MTAPIQKLNDKIIEQMKIIDNLENAAWPDIKAYTTQDMTHLIHPRVMTVPKEDYECLVNVRKILEASRE